MALRGLSIRASALLIKDTPSRLWGAESWPTFWDQFSNGFWLCFMQLNFQIKSKKQWKPLSFSNIFDDILCIGKHNREEPHLSEVIKEDNDIRKMVSEKKEKTPFFSLNYWNRNRPYYSIPYDSYIFIHFLLLWN